MRWALAIFLGLSVSGCATYVLAPDGTRTTSIEHVNDRVGISQPISYRVGYMDGCNSGRLSAGDSSFTFKKDTERTSVDDLYKHGWDDGFSQCKVAYARRTYYTEYYFWPGFYPVYSFWPSIHFGYGHHRSHHFSFGLHYGQRHRH